MLMRLIVRFRNWFQGNPHWDTDYADCTNWGAAQDICLDW